MTSQAPAAEPKAAATLHQLIVFVIDGENYAVPIAEVKEVVKGMTITPVPGSQVFILGIMNLRGKIVPVLDLGALFGLARKTALPSVPQMIIVESDSGDLFGVRVDRVSEITKVTGDMVQPAPTMVATHISPDYVEGVVVLAKTTGDGIKLADDVLLLLSLRKIITKEVMSAVETAVAQAQPVPASSDKGTAS